MVLNFVFFSYLFHLLPYGEDCCYTAFFYFSKFRTFLFSLVGNSDFSLLFFTVVSIVFLYSIGSLLYFREMVKIILTYFDISYQSTSARDNALRNDINFFCQTEPVHTHKRSGYFFMFLFNSLFQLISGARKTAVSTMFAVRISFN